MLNIKKSPHKKKIIITAVAVLLLAGAGTAYAVLGNKDSSENKKSPEVYNPTTMNSDSDVPKPDDKDNSGVTQSKNSKDDDGSSAPNSAVAPASPVGTFVSNHHPNLDGSPAPNVENSTCSTTPGVKCQIRFYRNGVTKSLPVQQTSQNGNTSWTWKLQDIGLTQGTWSVTAVAINGDKTASSQDATKLVVLP